MSFKNCLLYLEESNLEFVNKLLPEVKWNISIESHSNIFIA